MQPQMGLDVSALQNLSFEQALQAAGAAAQQSALSQVANLPAVQAAASQAAQQSTADRLSAFILENKVLIAIGGTLLLLWLVKRSPLKLAMNPRTRKRRKSAKKRK